MTTGVRTAWVLLPKVGGLRVVDACPAQAAGPAASERIEALDGLRGVLAMMVVIAHYFGEVPNGVSAVLFGWIAVKVFFVLSGFLMARIILAHVGTPGFFQTFYMRRLTRTLPVYLFTVAVVFLAASVFHTEAWMQAERNLPLWSYVTLTQPFVMIARGDYGSEWLTPTWTLTVEEQFYLIAPVLCLLVPRRHLLLALGALVGASVLFRAALVGGDEASFMAANITLPGAAHSMFLGMIAAKVADSRGMAWKGSDQALRALPVILLAFVFLLRAAGGKDATWFHVAGMPLISLAAAIYLLSIVRGAPEADRLTSPALKFLGRISYGTYLLHMPVLGLMHGILLAGKPDIATVAQVIVTLAAVPATIGTAWIVHRTIEQPMIEWGRKWSFASKRASA